jgi:biotin transport system substrate-specific component
MQIQQAQTHQQTGLFRFEIPALTGKIFGAAAFVLLLGLGAHVKVFLPGTPVPVTLQTLFVLLAGAMLGWRAGLASVVAYMTLGVLGLPLFSGAAVAGLAYLAGPTGGYLLGFMAAVVIIGLLTEKTAGKTRLALALLAGQAAIYLLGFSHLAFVYGLGPSGALLAGVVPFLPGAVIKTCAAWGILTSLPRLRH